MLKQRFWVPVLLSTLLLSGCITTGSIDAPQSQWQGRFSVRADNGNAQVSHTGNFRFFEIDSNHRVLELGSRIGTTLARIEEKDSHASLQALGMNEIEGRNAQELMQLSLGFSVPIDGLPYWIQGQCKPDVPCQVQPQTLPYELIEQSGWKVQYRYDTNGIANRITLTRKQSEFAPAIHLTLLVQSSQHANK